jgi:hypothetical protein
MPVLRSHGDGPLTPRWMAQRHEYAPGAANAVGGVDGATKPQSDHQSIMRGFVLKGATGVSWKPAKEFAANKLV